MVAPMAMQRMAHAEGEVAVACAAAEAGIPYVSFAAWTLIATQAASTLWNRRISLSQNTLCS